MGCALFAHFLPPLFSFSSLPFLIAPMDTFKSENKLALLFSLAPYLVCLFPLWPFRFRSVAFWKPSSLFLALHLCVRNLVLFLQVPHLFLC